MSAALDKDDGIVGCWSCHGPVAGRALFCHTCGAVQPPGQIDHFARLGIERDFKIDSAELDRRYFGFQRNLHPDRFARRSAKERAIAESQSASLNQAYETLKEPLSPRRLSAGARRHPQCRRPCRDGRRRRTADRGDGKSRSADGGRDAGSRRCD